MSSTTDNTAPTERQMRFMRSLAEETGTSFVYPKTRKDASAEIKRLIEIRDTAEVPSVEPGEPQEHDIERDDADEQLVYATGVAAEEVAGFGFTASWHTTSTPSVVVGEQRVTGQPTELERYRVSSGERVLYVQRVSGSVRITDRPASGQGRSYLVERKLEEDGYGALKALLVDYIEQARELDEVPMASSLIRRQIEARSEQE
ncbi:MAG TPA: hypothetical protein VFV03_00325 [Solirubrobacteraceae bacterium]|nr:hypothetical protein [Solirubrobacteraceae bacterium]